MTQPISLDAYRAARATPPDPLPEVEPIGAILNDWQESLGFSGATATTEITLAHLYAMAALLDVIAESDCPGNAAMGVSQTIYEEIARMAKAARKGRRR